LTCQVGANLSTNTNAVADFDVLDLVTDLDRTADNLVADAERERCLAPSTGDGVNIGAANTAGVNGNVDVFILKRLELEL